MVTYTVRVYANMTIQLPITISKSKSEQKKIAPPIIYTTPGYHTHTHTHIH